MAIRVGDASAQSDMNINMINPLHPAADSKRSLTGFGYRQTILAQLFMILNCQKSRDFLWFLYSWNCYIVEMGHSRRIFDNHSLKSSWLVAEYLSHCELVSIVVGRKALIAAGHLTNCDTNVSSGKKLCSKWNLNPRPESHLGLRFFPRSPQTVVTILIQYVNLQFNLIWSEFCPYY